MIRVLFVFSGKPCYDECFSPIVPLMSSKSYDLYLMLTFKGDFVFRKGRLVSLY